MLIKKLINHIATADPLTLFIRYLYCDHFLESHYKATAADMAMGILAKGTQDKQYVPDG